MNAATSITTIQISDLLQQSGNETPQENVSRNVILQMQHLTFFVEIKKAHFSIRKIVNNDGMTLLMHVLALSPGCKPIPTANVHQKAFIAFE